MTNGTSYDAMRFWRWDDKNEHDLTSTFVFRQNFSTIGINLLLPSRFTMRLFSLHLVFLYSGGHEEL